MASLHTRSVLTTLILTALAGSMQPAWATLPIDQQPLITQQQIKPAFLMSLDNSGSIGSDESLCISSQGECAWLPTAGGVQGTFFNSNGTMLVDGQVVGTVTVVDYFRAMRGGACSNTSTAALQYACNNNPTGDNPIHGGNFGLSGIDSTDGGNGNNDDENEVPRVDMYGAMRDPEFNRSYFNPSNSYTPWVNFDASPYLGSNADGSAIANFVNQTTGNAITSDATEDPRHPKTATDGGSPANINFTGSVLVTYHYYPGETIPKGNAFVWKTTGTTAAGGLECADLKALYPSGTDGQLITLTSNYTIPSSNCNGYITTRYYPATVYLTTNTASGADAIPGFNYSNVITVPNAGPYVSGAKTSLYKYEIIPANFSGGATDPNYLAAVQNFANYWSYYADRARAIVAAATQSFEGVNFMRVGAFNISPICAGVGNCQPLTTSAGYTKYISGPDSKYTTQPAGDPLVPMYDMSDYTYKTGVTINPVPPTGSTSSTAGGDRWNFYQQIFAFDRPNNNTPTRRAVYRAGHQFQRVINAVTTDGVKDSNPPILLACQANASMLFTDGYINDDNAGLPSVGNVDGGGVTDANSAPVAITGFGTAPFKDTQTSTMSDITAWFYQENLQPTMTTGLVPIESGCPNIQLDCNPNLHMRFYGIPLGAAGQYYDQVVSGVSYVDNSTFTLATAQAYLHPPTWGASGTMNLQPPDVDDIWHASINSRGQFISAQSPAAVRQGIETVINALLTASLPAGFLPVTGVRIGTNSLDYSPSFKKSGADWTGDVTAFTITSTGADSASADWDAKALLSALPNSSRDARNIVIDTTAGTYTAHPGSQFGYSPAQILTFGSSEATQLAYFGLNQNTFHALYGASPSTIDVIKYLMGDSSEEQSNGGQFRNRSGVLGDIVDSEPAIQSSADDFGFTLGLPAYLGGGAAYTTFLNAKASRTPATVLFVGANEGMLHAFNGTATGGNELFAFIPNSVTSNLGLLISPNYVHNFYVDGGTTTFDACFVPGSSTPFTVSSPCLAANWHSVLVGSTGAGGNGVFALDVSNPGSFSASNVMWEATSASDANHNIGANVGTPLVIAAEDGNWYAAFGNGYNSANSALGSGAALVLVNLATGVITKELVGTDNVLTDNGIGQIAAVDLTDTTGTGPTDGLVDTIYGGDYHGNVWKFDLHSATASNWVVANSGVPLYVAMDGASPANRQPITGGMEVAPGPLGGQMVYFGTGSFFLTTDNPNAVGVAQPIQSLYAVWDNGTADTTGRSSLVQQSITLNNATSPATRNTTSNPVTYNTTATTQRGFYMDLINPNPVSPIVNDDGEKFFGTARVLNDIVFFTTFEPSGTACNPGGIRWEYGLNALTGANALSSLAIGSLTGTQVCPGGGCGAVQIGTGAPVRDTSLVIPPAKQCIPLIDASCPSTGNPSELNLYSACEVIVRAPGAQPLALPRPCGRQSWRQVR